MPTAKTTTEQYLHRTREAVITHALTTAGITADEAHRLTHAKLLYGVGDGTYRGICHFNAWENGVGRVDIVEIAATAQESWIQLAGTTIHELAHVLAGFDAGHGTDWKDAAKRLGFTIRPNAAGQVYSLAMLHPTIRHAVHALAGEIGDGRPEFARFGPAAGRRAVPVKPRPCSAGIGTKGGTSRGKGSGSRLRLWECECPKPVKVRVASDDFRATCDECGSPFARKVAKAELTVAA